MDNKGLEHRVTVLEEEIEKLKDYVVFDKNDCGFYD